MILLRMVIRNCKPPFKFICLSLPDLLWYDVVCPSVYTQCLSVCGPFQTDRHFMADTGILSNIWSLPLANVMWHSAARPFTVTSKPIRLFTNSMTFIPSLTFTELRVVLLFSWSICIGCGIPAGNFKTLTLPDTWFQPFLGFAYAPIVDISFRKLAMIFPTFHL